MTLFDAVYDMPLYVPETDFACAANGNATVNQRNGSKARSHGCSPCQMPRCCEVNVQVVLIRNRKMTAK